MKRNKEGIRIFSLLASNYLAFTAILVLIFLGTYLAGDLYTGRMLHTPDGEALIRTQEFREGNYQAVDVQRYLGPNGGFSVLDGNARVIYASTGQIPSLENPEDLLCIPQYNGKDVFDGLTFQTEDGQQRLIITRSRYSEDGSVQTDIALLDENYHVLGGSLLPGKTDYTQQQVDFLLNRWSENFWLTQLRETDAQGNALTVLLLIPRYSDTFYQEILEQSGRMWLLAIPLYLAATLIFIVLMDRHFRRPLARLNQAIVRLGAGEKVSAGDCGGPREIRNLGKSFDEMARKLAQSQAQTRKLEEQRIKMLTDISHDLKTPITVISGYTDAIRDGKVPQEELPQYLETIGKKANALTELINSFHEYSKTEHPDFRLNRTETDLCEFLREYLAEKFNEIDLAGFALEVEIPEKRIIYAIDRFQLRRALDNIFSNALKHNRLGTLIWVKLEQVPGAVLLEIADNGDGIPGHLRKDLFSPFVVGDRSRSRGGSGLGLAISQKIILAHGWTIRLAEEKMEDGGTVFEIRMPQL